KGKETEMAADIQSPEPKYLLFAGRVLVYLINSGLVELDSSTGKEQIFGLGRLNIGGHLRLFAFGVAPKIDFSLLRVGFVHNFLILVPDEIGSRGTKLGSGCVHLAQDTVQRGCRCLPRR